ncbi:hypothetical protein RhiirA5_430294 [Rhizophagus irregularis]|uniref:Uncharacterized protein n=1 Tax=Rhizophagus irregularis TaxID=588596 RepID=A0A2N0NWZ6_9GLOM|nr:hypothetical protein RhiirA5_430294 [Rhizophagus irregularis]
MTSVTGIYQTATDFEPAIYKRLKGLQTTYSNEFYELDVVTTVCKQLDVHQEKLHEGTSHSKLLPQRPEQQEEETALLTEEKHLIHMKDNL